MAMADRILKRGDRYKLFAREYIIDLNGTRAAIAAGYSPKGAHVQASLLLRNPKVSKLISELIAKREKGLDCSADRILEELTKLGFSNMMDFMTPRKQCSKCKAFLEDDMRHRDLSPICEGAFAEATELGLDFSKLTRDQAAAIQEYTVDATGGTGDGERKQVMRTRFKLADKTRALELLGKYRKLFVERVEVTGDADILAALSAGRQRLAKRQAS